MDIYTWQFNSFLKILELKKRSSFHSKLCVCIEMVSAYQWFYQLDNNSLHIKLFHVSMLLASRLVLWSMVTNFILVKPQWTAACDWSTKIPDIMKNCLYYRIIREIKYNKSRLLLILQFFHFFLDSFHILFKFIFVNWSTINLSFSTQILFLILCF